MDPGRFRGTLKPLSLVDILLFLRGLNRTGLLSLNAGGTSVGLYLRGGAVVQATSSRPADRLAAMALRRGLITSEQHDEALRRAAAGEGIGRALVAAGLPPRDLVEARLRQVRDIALSPFEWAEGEFAFTEDEEYGDPGLEVRLEVFDLIAEAIRGLRSPELFERRLGSDERVFAPAPDDGGDPSAGLEPHEEQVRRLVDGRRTVGAITALSDFPPAEVRRVLLLLYAAGRILPRLPQGEDADDAPPESEIDAILRRYNGMFGRLFEHLMREAGPIAEDLLVKTLREAESAHAAVLAGVALGGDGTLDPVGLRDNLGRVAGRARRAALVEGLNELLYADLLVVRRTLGPELEGRLLREFGDDLPGTGPAERR